MIFFLKIVVKGAMHEMDKDSILKLVDHTLLKAASTWPEIDKLCGEAAENKMAAVCVPPCFVKRVKDAYGDLTICTVIGFPLGYNETAVKVFETRTAVEAGADEIDMVINIGRVKDGDFDYVESEISEIKKACCGKLLKVIIETCYLTEEEKTRLCKIVTQTGADFIKTSTGFGTAGATLEDIELFKSNIGGRVKIKASGGIKTAETLEKFAAAGCRRIGTSSALSILGDN